MPIQTARLKHIPNHAAGPHIQVDTPEGVVSFGPVKSDFWDHEHVGIYTPVTKAKPKKFSAKRQKRTSRDQELSIMEELGGQRQAGSGSRPGLKGDVRVRNKYRIEAKYTRKESYRVTREELNKIRGECTGSEVPLFVVGFMDPQTGGSEDRWVLVPFATFQKMDANAATDDSGSTTPR